MGNSTREESQTIAIDAGNSPMPWSVKRSGAYIAILDRDGSTVIKKVVSQVTLEQYRVLAANFDFIVTACNATVTSDA